jgi:predicted ATPase
MGRDASVAARLPSIPPPARVDLFEAMRIEELVLEGLKSYPVRTSITGWDASFNAITGLNGSGKSNILDAICFVLGITNMSQVSRVVTARIFTF